LHFVGFVEVEGYFFCGGGRGFEGPGAFGGVDFVGEGALSEGMLVGLELGWG